MNYFICLGKVKHQYQQGLAGFSQCESVLFRPWAVFLLPFLIKKNTNFPLVLALAGTTLGEKREPWEEGSALRCCRTREDGAQLPNLFVRGTCCGPKDFVPMFIAVQIAI